MILLIIYHIDIDNIHIDIDNIPYFQTHKCQYSYLQCLCRTATSVMAMTEVPLIHLVYKTSTVNFKSYLWTLVWLLNGLFCLFICMCVLHPTEHISSSHATAGWTQKRSLCQSVAWSNSGLGHRGFHKWGYPNSWMVYFMENPIYKWMIYICFLFCFIFFL